MLAAIAEGTGASLLVAGFVAGIVLAQLRQPERLVLQLSGLANGFFEISTQSSSPITSAHSWVSRVAAWLVDDILKTPADSHYGGVTSLPGLP